MPGYLEKLRQLILFKLLSTKKKLGRTHLIWRHYNCFNVIASYTVHKFHLLLFCRFCPSFLNIFLRRCRQCHSPRSPLHRTVPPQCRAFTPVQRWLLRAAPGTPSSTTRDKCNIWSTEENNVCDTWMIWYFWYVYKVHWQRKQKYFCIPSYMCELRQDVLLVEFSPVRWCQAPCPSRPRR